MNDLVKRLREAERKYVDNQYNFWRGKMKPSDKIWLEPECDECDERCWSCAPFEDCEECGKETIGYVRDDIVLAASQEASRMFDRIEELEKQLSASNRHIMDLEEKIEELEYEIYELGTRND
jgi:ribosomal protein L44E